MADEDVDLGDAEGGEAPAPAADSELAELQAMLEEMEQNQSKITEASSAAAAQASTAVAAKGKADEDRAARDERSVFVGNVDFATTGEELMGYFSSCGTIERVTILSDKFGNPKGCVVVGRWREVGWLGCRAGGSAVSWRDGGGDFLALPEGGRLW